jgi:hypothetical protein
LPPAARASSVPAKNTATSALRRNVRGSRSIETSDSKKQRGDDAASGFNRR